MPSDRRMWDYEAIAPMAGATHDAARGGDLNDDAGGRKRVSILGNEVRIEHASDSLDGKDTRSTKTGAFPNVLRRGHSLTYAALFLFTVILYLRPADLWPSAFTASIAFVFGTITLAVFLLTQISLEGNLTARPREVNLVLLFCLLALLSMPLAIEPALVWETFSGIFIRCVIIFVVMVNAVRTTTRLRGMLWIAIAAGLALSFNAVNDYRLGNLTVEGYRVGGVGEGLFGNPNEMALFLVTVIPIAAALGLGSRSFFAKIFYAASALLMVAAITVTFSRGGFLGLAAALGFMAWKVGRRSRLMVVALVLACGVLFLLLSPPSFSLRLLSIFIPSLDPVGSSEMRQQLLWQSIWTAARHPLLGIGMGNFTLVSPHSLVSHNSYTQVASEMGMSALVVYSLFILTPFKGLARIDRESYDERKRSRFHYLAVGIQASLVGYMVNSFFASVAYVWYVYYVVGYAVCLRRIYESEAAVNDKLSRHAAVIGDAGAEGETDDAHASAAV